MSAKFKIYVTGNDSWIRRVLEEDGFAVLDRESAAPGEDLAEVLRSADAVFLVYGGDSSVRPADWELDGFLEGFAAKSLVGVPVIYGVSSNTQLPNEVATVKPIELRHPSPFMTFGDVHSVKEYGQSIVDQNRLILVETARRLRRRALASDIGNGMKQASSLSELYRPSRSALKLSRVKLVNIGCFEEIELSLDFGWTTVLGDNSAGKSTLLRGLCLGLCTENETAALVSMMPGAVRRHGFEEGHIDLELLDTNAGSRFRVVTTFRSGPKGNEEIRKKTEPADGFPWDRLLVCAYGTNRSREGTASHDEYSLLAAVRPLFDESVHLQNPELILLRQKNGRQRDLEERLLSIMMLDGARFEYTGKGPIIRGEWGDQPIRSLSDGYRSTLQWVLDFCAWEIYYGLHSEFDFPGGILLIDELEQHLHPRWQRHIVKRLRQQFPGIQVFATTHTPLVAAGIADIESGQVVRLEGQAGGTISVDLIEPNELWGKRADQVLTEAFGLFTTSNVASETPLDRYTELIGIANRSEIEDAELQELQQRLRETLSLGQSKAEREAERIVERVLDEMSSNVNKEQIDFETRRLLQDILRPGKES